MSNYWLIKSEPSDYSIDDFQQDCTAIWDGVRNHQAKNFLCHMKIGDTAFFYHSNIKTPAVVGLAEIVEEKVIDPTQFDPNSRYYDQRSQPDAPRWYTVKLKFLEKFVQEISLKTLKERFTPEEFMLVMRGSRLSVMPVDPSVAERILNLARS